jgi:hypothetical protein
MTRFSERGEGFTDKESTGRPATSRTEENFAKVLQIMSEHRRLTLGFTAEQADIDRKNS